jgi:hypothetical protein
MIFARDKKELSIAAKDIQNNLAFKEAFGELEQHYLLQIRNSKADEDQLREYFYVALRVLDAVKANLVAYVDDSKITESNVIQRQFKRI